MFLRFENGILAEVSPVEYRKETYLWFPAPPDFDPNALYLLVDGVVVIASLEQQQANTLEAEKAVMMTTVTRLLDDFRLDLEAFLPGKEREYRLKQSIVENYTGNALDDPMAVSLLTEEANYRGVSVDELIAMIKTKIEASYQEIGRYAGLAVWAKNLIENATSVELLDAAYAQIEQTLRSSATA